MEPTRSAVKLSPVTLSDVARLAGGWHLLKFRADSCEFTVFPDGRAIITGTSDVDKARTLYAKYIGH